MMKNFQMILFFLSPATIKARGRRRAVGFGPNFTGENLWRGRFPRENARKLTTLTERVCDNCKNPGFGRTVRGG